METAGRCPETARKLFFLAFGQIKDLSPAFRRKHIVFQLGINSVLLAEQMVDWKMPRFPLPQGKAGISCEINIETRSAGESEQHIRRIFLRFPLQHFKEMADLPQFGQTVDGQFFQRDIRGKGGIPFADIEGDAVSARMRFFQNMKEIGFDRFGGEFLEERDRDIHFQTPCGPIGIRE